MKTPLFLASFITVVILWWSFSDGDVYKPLLKSSPVVSLAHIPTRISHHNTSWVPCTSDHKVYSTVPLPQHCFNFNLVFRKAKKVGGSTMGGVARRIAIRFGVRGSRSKFWHQNVEPKLLANHITEEDFFEWRNALQMPSFTWGLVRNPIDRCISAFDFFSADVSDTAKIHFGKHYLCTNSVWHAMQLNNSKSREDLQFMGVTERFDESALVLCYFLGCSLADLLYFPSKDSQRSSSHTSHVPFDQESPEVRSYFLGGNFRQRNSLDYHLWDTANQTLDRLIDFIGRKEFETRLNQYHKHMNDSHIECRHVDIRRCYWKDNGCKYDCLDKYANKVTQLWDPITTRPLLYRENVPLLNL